MASASADASTPFFTSTPSNAVTFAFPGAAVRFGEGFAFGVAAAGSALAASPFAGFASLLPAINGRAMMASTSRHHNNRFSVNIDGLSSFWLRPRHRTWSGTLRHFLHQCQGRIAHHGFGSHRLSLGWRFWKAGSVCGDGRLWSLPRGKPRGPLSEASLLAPHPHPCAPEDPWQGVGTTRSISGPRGALL